jgi:hypothetical protein
MSVTATVNGCTGPARNLTIFYQNVPMPEFYSRNLGADPARNTAKQQMQYYRPGGGHTGELDGRVFGGRYQWGRDNAAGYAIHPTTYALYKDNTNAAALANGATYHNTTGQILTYNTASNNATFLHIYSIQPTPYDWRMSTPNGSRKDDLWGNGRSITSNTNALTDPGIKRNDGNHYQGTTRVLLNNDPCSALPPHSSGDYWRLPTQDEWERLVNYGCNEQNAISPTWNIAASVLWESTNTGFTWVRVSDAIPFLGLWSATARNGYAVYRTDVWSAAVAVGGYFAGLTRTGGNLNTVFATKRLYDAGAPVPVLFLPAAGRRTAGVPAGSTTGAELVSPHERGNYWSATISGGNAYNLHFTAIAVSSGDVNSRSFASSVRCVRDIK